ncbi:MAG: hypothetical protein GY805_05040 [Chloroflexi bacterium]|nr:hypothetical protein [Chloroflexota bacterium]
MTTTHHTAIGTGAAADAATFNSPLGELDAAITTGLSQLSADLDANGFDMQFNDATGLRDDSDNEQLIFQKMASAVNYLEIANAATGNGPGLAAAGETNTDLRLDAKGSGDLVLQNTATGNVGIGDGSPSDKMVVNAGTDVTIANFISSSANSLSRIGVANEAAANTLNRAALDFTLDTSVQHRTVLRFQASLSDTIEATAKTKTEFKGYDNGSLATRLTILGENVGIGTTLPGQILDVNQGSGNMIADGYDTHSLAEYKENIKPARSALSSLDMVGPKEWTRVPHISAEELRKFAIENHLELWMAEFGGELNQDGVLEGDNFRGGRLKQIKNAALKAAIDAEGERLRTERRDENRWKKMHIGLIANDPLVKLHLPEVLAVDKDGDPQGIDLVSYIGLLHKAILELKAQLNV